MNKRSKRVYDKAMNYYEKGKIDKALEICESELSENLKNSAMLNLKGLLLYQKGELNEAVAVWKINKDLNNDFIAKKYIKDVESDKKRLELYIMGENELKQLKVDSAIELFKTCAESDFNAINVNAALSLCYQKKGDFKRAREYVNKALSIDENSTTARSIKKDLEEIGMYEEEKVPSKKVVMLSAGLIFIIIVCLASYRGIGKWKENSITKNNEQLKQIENIEQNNTDKLNTNAQDEVKDSKANDESVEEDKTNNNSYFNKEKLIASINNDDVDQVYNELKNIKEENVKIEDKDIYNKGIDLLKTTGIEKFYEYGLWNFNQKNYDSAETQLEKAYQYCNDSYLKQHIIYYKASTLCQKGDIPGALKGYEEYYKQYSKGSYIEEVLYEISLLNNDIDKGKSKYYANILMNNYPKSIYINDNISNIINS